VSDTVCSVERMFEGVDPGGLIDVIGEAARAESAAIARRLAAVGVLDALRAVELAERRWWRTDPFQEVAAEISAAQNISRGRAGNQVYLARALRDDLPAVAAVFATGAIDYRMVEVIITRTANVDADRMAQVDAAIGQRCVRWMRLSKPKLADRIDVWVAKCDPDAVRVPPAISEARYVETAPTSAGMAGIWANVDAADAAVFDATLEALADTVCEHDPRTKAQRRADALRPLARGDATLACRCGLPSCPAAAQRSALSAVVIQVLAEQATLAGTSDQPGYLPGYGVLPAESVRELAASGAACTPLPMPPDTPAPGYRPTAAQAAFLRWRDLTCRFPGCDAPAQVCDVDHTKPYPHGATHPSNTKLYCRHHHLLKTFYAGFGWTDRQLPDGTIVWTAPTGHTYTTQPHGGALFPALAQPTAELPEGIVPEQSPHHDTMMPTRRQTREQDRHDRITQERRERHNLNRQQQRQHQAWLAANHKPPPF
jgi:hypothetical protein